MKRILVFFGGCSSEYGVSLQSAHAVLTHMNRETLRPLPVGITREGRWLYYPGPLSRLPAGDFFDRPSPSRRRWSEALWTAGASLDILRAERRREP